tara:strand:- start:110 stop:490 length:381 start_codon:yes stop_codon:yes gene_type:complete
MGDIGSTFLAALYLGCLYETSDLSKTFIYLFTLLPFWLDCITCIIRRLANKQNIFLPHKLHLYQRLNQAGWSHSRVSLLYILISFTLSLGALSANIYTMAILSILLCLSGVALNRYVAYRFTTNVK